MGYYGLDPAIYQQDSSKSSYLLGRRDNGVFLAKINPDQEGLYSGQRILLIIDITCIVVSG